MTQVEYLAAADITFSEAHGQKVSIPELWGRLPASCQPF